MKKRSASRIFINPITIVFILISLIYNRFLYLFIHYLIAFIHEMSHVFAAKSFKVDVQEIKFLPFGFYAKMDRLEEARLLPQLIIIASGPLSFFISLGVIKYLLNCGFISQYGYNYAFQANLAILLFNLIPFYPLDGGRLIDSFLSCFISEKKTRYIRHIINSVAVFGIFILCYQEKQWMILVFMLFSYLLQLYFSKKDYFTFLINRLITKHFHLKPRINNKLEIYRLRDNYCLKNMEIIDEPEIIKTILTQKVIESKKKGKTILRR